MRGQIGSLFGEEELEAGFSHVCRDHTRVVEEEEEEVNMLANFWEKRNKD